MTKTANMNKAEEVKCTVICTDRCYHDVTIYKFDGITMQDMIEQLQCQRIYRVISIMEH